MQGTANRSLERRLQERYLILVKSQMRSTPELAAGIASLPSAGSSFAATQAAWRFLNNDRVTLPLLIEPLREVGVRRAKGSQAGFVLLVHDWSKLSFRHTRRKRDLVQLTHASDVGYELTTTLLVSGDDGSPLAPMEIHLKTADGVLSTRDPAPKTRPHLEQVLPTMQASRSWGLCKPIVHVIDREADSVDHYRRWDKEGHKFLIRVDDRRVRCHGQSCLLSGIAQELQRSNRLQHVGSATYHGRDAELWVAETEVVLHRPAKKNVGGKKVQRPGRALPLRFIVVALRDDAGNILAPWMLLSNVPRAWATTEHLARCYYWRWRIESFFKLLKSHGQQLERWQQETGGAVARRLLVAAMACVVVWQLQADNSPAAVYFKNVLVRLSGRQTKRKRPHTAPALLAGLGVLLAMLLLLEHEDLHAVKRLAEELLYLPSG
jgi:Transposase DDE domain